MSNVAYLVAEYSKALNAGKEVVETFNNWEKNWIETRTIPAWIEIHGFLNELNQSVYLIERLETVKNIAGQPAVNELFNKHQVLINDLMDVGDNFLRMENTPFGVILEKEASRF